jgi:hypothetical protein
MYGRAAEERCDELRVQRQCAVGGLTRVAQPARQRRGERNPAEERLAAPERFEAFGVPPVLEMRFSLVSAVAARSTCQ